jgi:hypothetical protein
LSGLAVTIAEVFQYLLDDFLVHVGKHPLQISHGYGVVRAVLSMRTVGTLVSLHPRCMGWFPPIDERLVAGLATEFRDQAPDLSWNEKEVWFKAGQVSVVRWLAAKYEDQQENGVAIDLEGF